MIGRLHPIAKSDALAAASRRRKLRRRRRVALTWYRRAAILRQESENGDVGNPRRHGADGDGRLPAQADRGDARRLRPGPPGDDHPLRVGDPLPHRRAGRARPRSPARDDHRRAPARGGGRDPARHPVQHGAPLVRAPAGGDGAADDPHRRCRRRRDGAQGRRERHGRPARHHRALRAGIYQGRFAEPRATSAAAPKTSRRRCARSGSSRPTPSPKRRPSCAGRSRRSSRAGAARSCWPARKCRSPSPMRATCGPTASMRRRGAGAGLRRRLPHPRDPRPRGIAPAGRMLETAGAV